MRSQARVTIYFNEPTYTFGLTGNADLLQTGFRAFQRTEQSFNIGSTTS